MRKNKFGIFGEYSFGMRATIGLIVVIALISVILTIVSIKFG